MTRIAATLSVGLITLAIAQGCATREQTGALVGGAAGAAVGSTIGRGEGRTAAIILGTLAGTMIGQTMGRYMDEQDRMRTAMVLENNRTNQSSTWQNPDTGNAYVVTPTRTYESAQGPCREFTMDATIGGKRQHDLYGTACRQPDGSWKIVQQ